LSYVLHFPPGLDATGFLRSYWQRRPLVMRGALPEFRSPLSAEELAGLACEPEVESRLVLEHDGDHPWEVRHGPFEDADFSELPDSHWTLLVQDVDKFDPQVLALLDAFRFIPDWRVDDIMISYAADAGSVGPHVDDYDVFLIQAAGKRRWRIDPGPDPDLTSIPDLDLRILQRFEAREEQIMEPGDVLYLPPGIPHWGIAEGSCLTFSVGFRAAAWRELAASWCDFAAERQLSIGRFRDQALTPQNDSAEILPEVFDQVCEVLTQGLRDASGRLLREWFGRFVTEQKENLQVFPTDGPLTPENLRSHIANGGTLLRRGVSRMAFSRGEDVESLLYANGDVYAIKSENSDFLVLITRERNLSRDMLEKWLERTDCLDLLHHLYIDGNYELAI